jgi:hypothetical protein
VIVDDRLDDRLDRLICRPARLGMVVGSTDPVRNPMQGR